MLPVDAADREDRVLDGIDQLALDGLRRGAGVDDRDGDDGGCWTSGNSSVFRATSAMSPKTTSASITVTVTIGFLMAKSEMNIGSRPRLRRRVVAERDLHRDPLHLPVRDAHHRRRLARLVHRRAGAEGRALLSAATRPCA